MDQNELLAQLHEAFRAEATERLETLSGALLRLLEAGSEGMTGSTELEQAHRDFHSLKGAANAVGMEDVAALCFEGEKLLKHLCNHPERTNPGHVDALLATAATVERAALSAIELDEAEVDSLCERLQIMTSQKDGDQEAAETPAVPSEQKPASRTVQTGDLDAQAAMQTVRRCMDELPEDVDTTELRDAVDTLDLVLGRRRDILGMLLSSQHHHGNQTACPMLVQLPEEDTRPRSQNGKRILVVEDSPTSRMLIQSILEEDGYLVLTAVDGAEGYDKLKSDGADLVVSDVEMPRMSGFEMSQTIREDSGLRDLPIVLVTSLSSEENREKGMAAGANAYIVKGDMKQEVLLEVVRKLISGRERQ